MNVGQARKRLDAGDDRLRPALQQLLRQADEARKLTPPSVLDKKLTPPSGDKHDYMSLGPYWWPDPEKPDGKPYQRRDGQVNPESTSGDTDRPALSAMKAAVETLVLAWRLTDEEQYAAHAGVLLRVWFLDSGTRMNPHLRFGQSIPGRLEGRGIGIIDTGGLAGLCDSAVLLQSSASWTPADQRGLQQWFTAYLDWLLTSSHGKDEAKQDNNQGTWYDVQVARFALFTGQETLARTTVERAKQRLAAQVAVDGRQPHELARTKAFSYSVMNLKAFFDLAEMGQSLDVDLWNYQPPQGGGIAAALDFLAPYADPQKPWPYPQIGEGNFRLNLLPLLKRGAQAYGGSGYEAMLEKLPTEEVAAHRAQLMYAD